MAAGGETEGEFVSKQRRIVQVMHKLTARTTGDLAVGKTFNFQSGDAYLVQRNGSVLSQERKPWRNKAEMKAYHKRLRDEGRACERHH